MVLILLCNRVDAGGTGTKVINNTDGPVKVRSWVKTDDPKMNFFYTLDVIPLDPGCEVVIDFDKLIAESKASKAGKGKYNAWPLKGKVQERYLETTRVLERISVNEREYKRYIKNKVKICTVPVVQKDSEIKVRDIERSPSCEITEISQEEYVNDDSDGIKKYRIKPKNAYTIPDIYELIEGDRFNISLSNTHKVKVIVEKEEGGNWRGIDSYIQHPYASCPLVRDGDYEPGNYRFKLENNEDCEGNFEFKVLCSDNRDAVG